MTSIGFIPLRRDSKGLTGKNKLKLLGRPLFCWVLTEAIFSDLDKIFVFTNDPFILDFVKQQYSWTPKVEIIKRSEKNAGDTSSTEAAIFEFTDNMKEFDVFCLLQGTSVFTSREDINTSLGKIKEGGYDSCLSVVRTHRFIWEEEGNSLNYDFNKRPRRQDFNGLLVENGALYCTTREGLMESGNRLSGKIGMVEMPEHTYTEIDDLKDFQLVEVLMKQQLKKKKTLCPITHLVLDVDGVFTNGTVTYSQEGEFSKTFDMRDGMGLEIIRQNGIKVIVITSENSPIVASRMKKLNIDKVFLGIKDKFSCLQQILIEDNLNLCNLAYIGDDVNDMANICAVGWSFAPSNAMSEIIEVADVVLSSSSGNGAIREAANFIIKYNNRFEQSK